jgi:hypothetical protein
VEKRLNSETNDILKKLIKYFYKNTATSLLQQYITCNSGCVPVCVMSPKWRSALKNKNIFL